LLARKFALYFLAPLLLLLAAVGVTIYLATADALQEQVDRTLLASANALDRAIATRIASIRTDLRVMEAERQLEEYLQFLEFGRIEDADRRLLVLEENYAVIAALKPRCKSFRLFDAQGRQRIGIVGGERSYLALDVGATDWFRAARTAPEGEVQISGVQKGRISGMRHEDNRDPARITLAMPVRFHGSVRAVLAIEILVEDLTSDLMLAARAPAGGHVFLLDPQGIVVASDGPGAPEGDLADAYATQKLRAGYRGVTSLDREGLRTAYLPQSDTQLGLFLAVPTQTVFAPLHRLRNVFLAITLIGFLVLAATGFLLVRRRVRPIHALTEHVAQVADGNLEGTIEIETGDEIETLAHGLNQMTRKLGESRDTLESRARQLEEAYRNLQETQRQLAQAEKMSLLGQLAGGIAHDFNNLLGGIIGAADLLQRKGDMSEEQQQYLGMIGESGQRAADLVRQLLAFARPGLKTRIAVDVHALIEEVIRILRRTVDPRVKIHKRLKAEPSTVEGDPTALQSALLNLGVNARDAMPEGGRLSFTTTVVHFDEETCLQQPHAIQPGPFVEVGIADTGTGIGKELLGRIFEPFFTTKEAGAGTGLGLAAVYGTVKSHDGTINVYSEPGEGTLFKLYFPALLDAEAPPAPAPEVVRGSGRILLVDDEAVIRNLARDMLRGLGYEVLLAGDGPSALEIFAEQRDSIDLVILDLVMPGMNGKQVLRKLKKADPDARVLIASGFHLDMDMPDVRREGASGFLSKPFIVADLSQAVANALRAAPVAVGTLHVLVVDDSMVFRDVIAAQLRELGHHVEAVDNGERAVIAAAADSFDIAFIDVELPGMSGLEAARAIRVHESEAGGHLPIVAMTGHGREEEEPRCREADMDGFLSKPASIEDIRAEIDRVIRR
jgi:signal transduction histidine kinase/CheY-like chemotaxis protein